MTVLFLGRYIVYRPGLKENGKEGVCEHAGTPTTAVRPGSGFVLCLGIFMFVEVR